MAAAQKQTLVLQRADLSEAGKEMWHRITHCYSARPSCGHRTIPLREFDSVRLQIVNPAHAAGLTGVELDLTGGSWARWSNDRRGLERAKGSLSTASSVVSAWCALNPTPEFVDCKRVGAPAEGPNEDGQGGEVERVASAEPNIAVGLEVRTVEHFHRQQATRLSVPVVVDDPDRTWLWKVLGIEKARRA